MVAQAQLSQGFVLVSIELTCKLHLCFVVAEGLVENHVPPVGDSHGNGTH
jgi:hypothetical protein